MANSIVKKIGPEGLWFLRQLSSMHNDCGHFRVCSRCASGDKKRIKYSECGGCPHFSADKLRQISAKIKDARRAEKRGRDKWLE